MTDVSLGYVDFERWTIAALLITIILSWWAHQEASSAEFHARQAHRRSRATFEEVHDPEDTEDA